jgi:Tol biopolymer transport system component
MISDPDNSAVHSHPTFSPDGKLIAFLAMTRATYESDRLQIVIANRVIHSLSYPTREVDLSFSSVTFGPDIDGENNDIYTLFCIAQYRGSSRVYKVKIQNGAFMSMAVMPGDESRSNIMIVNNKDHNAKKSSRSLFFFESTLCNNFFIVFFSDYS